MGWYLNIGGVVFRKLDIYPHSHPHPHPPLPSGKLGCAVIRGMKNVQHGFPKRAPHLSEIAPLSIAGNSQFGERSL